MPLRKLNELRDILSGEVSSTSLQFLLSLMHTAFEVSYLPLSPLKDFHRNIDSFDGTIAFTSSDDLLKAAAIFSGGNMEVSNSIPDDWDVKIVFTDVPAFWRFIFSEGDDILTSILANDVEVEGNLNYLYKFGFMARDLLQRVGIER